MSTKLQIKSLLIKHKFNSKRSLTLLIDYLIRCFECEINKNELDINKIIDYINNLNLQLNDIENILIELNNNDDNNNSFLPTTLINLKSVLKNGDNSRTKVPSISTSSSASSPSAVEEFEDKHLIKPNFDTKNYYIDNQDDFKKFITRISLNERNINKSIYCNGYLNNYLEIYLLDYEYNKKWDYTIILKINNYNKKDNYFIFIEFEYDNFVLNFKFKNNNNSINQIKLIFKNKTRENLINEIIKNYDDFINNIFSYLKINIINDEKNNLIEYFLGHLTGLNGFTSTNYMKTLLVQGEDIFSPLSTNFKISCTP